MSKRPDEQTEFGLRALVQLAAARDVLVPTGELAGAIPGRVLEAVMTRLRRAGLVRGVRGPEGGFQLARSADQISLADIVAAMTGL